MYTVYKQPICFRVPTVVTI